MNPYLLLLVGAVIIWLLISGRMRKVASAFGG